MTKVSVLASARSAILFARANVVRVMGVLSLVMLLNIAGEMAVSRVAQGLTFVATVLAGLMANAALLRLAFADEHSGDPEFHIGPQGFQFGLPEVRLLGAMLLLGLFGFIALLFMLLLAALFTVGLVFSHGQTVIAPEAAARSPDVQLMLSVLILAFFGLALWVWVRVFTYPAATIAERKVQVFSTWKFTAGTWWRIFAAFLLLSLPAFVSDGLLLASQAYPPMLFGFAILSAAVNAFIEIPLLCGLSADLYRQLRAEAAPHATPMTEDGRPSLAGPWG